MMTSREAREDVSALAKAFEGRLSPFLLEALIKTNSA